MKTMLFQTHNKSSTYNKGQTQNFKDIFPTIKKLEQNKDTIMLDGKHTYGNININLSILHKEQKGRFLDMLE